MLVFSFLCLAQYPISHKSSFLHSLVIMLSSCHTSPRFHTCSNVVLNLAGIQPLSLSSLQFLSYSPYIFCLLIHVLFLVSSKFPHYAFITNVSPILPYWYGRANSCHSIHSPIFRVTSSAQLPRCFSITRPYVSMTLFLKSRLPISVGVVVSLFVPVSFLLSFL